MRSPVRRAIQGPVPRGVVAADVPSGPGTPRGGRLLASVRDSPPQYKWAEGPRGGGGGGFWGGGLAAEEGLPRGLASRC